MTDFKIIGERCEDCGHTLVERTHGYWVRNPFSNQRRRICGFCWCNPGWPALDPEYRERQINAYARKHIYPHTGLLANNTSPKHRLSDAGIYYSRGGRS